MQELNLNDFEKKAVLNSLRDFDVINLIAYNHIASENVYYTLFYRHRGFIFSTCLFFTNSSETDRSVVLSTYIRRIQEVINVKLNNIDNNIFNKKRICNNSIDFISDYLYITIVECHRDFTDFNFIDSPIDNGTSANIIVRCKNLLNEGKSPSEVLKIYLNNFGINPSIDMIQKIQNTKIVHK